MCGLDRKLPEIPIVLVNTMLGTVSDKRELLYVIKGQAFTKVVGPFDQRAVFCPMLADPFATRKNCSRARADETSG